MPPLDKRRQDENGHDVWPDKHTFCNAYKFNEDGLAERIQAAIQQVLKAPKGQYNDYGGFAYRSC